LSGRTPKRNAALARSLPISKDDPWILQEFIAGREYCTHGTVRNGRLQVYACCESSASQLNYAMADKPEIRSWVEKFVGALGVTGQLSFDFIEAADGRVYAIECNPRTHSPADSGAAHRKPLASAGLGEDRPQHRQTR
jgi:carbamoylphosphate synthase large subunit